MAGWTGKRVNVSYSRPEEPAFLKRFKEQVGYKEDNGLQEKFAVMPAATDEDLEDQDDDMPQVVSLRSNDLTQEECDKLRAEGKLDDLLRGNCEKVNVSKEEDEEPPPDGRILFRKPTKRSGEDKDGKTDPKKLKGDEKEKKSKKDKKKDLQKKKLLSFNEDEEEEEN
ncbi:uncharacterized protein KIAA1143 homolog [Homarus americanus]|uniref:DUF4604 domain-containing protein n=1 Tax=Homarus americanus TaxID=6706 RepID=A0A8J5KDF1_HOMAM|nr:uncharacterized protein KIAA1143 homolog [Homarus americanus]KAG7167904.1 hypothetical protein Hamer_G023360 [Homarus americanus]